MKSAPEIEQAGQPDPDEELYPEGLKICLCKDDLEKIGINSMPRMGTEITFTAKAMVVGISSTETQGNGSEMEVEFQITDMGLDKQSEATKSAATMLYG